MSDAEDFISGISYEQFTNDQKTLNAVLRSIEVIGEAAKNIPDNIRNLYQDIPWREMAGMRDKVIHFYFGVDKEVIWFVVKERIPDLKPVISRLLRELEDQGI